MINFTAELWECSRVNSSKTEVRKESVSKFNIFMLNILGKLLYIGRLEIEPIIALLHHNSHMLSPFFPKDSMYTYSLLGTVEFVPEIHGESSRFGM